MRTTDRHIEFDSRLWDIARLLKSGDLERARVESALLLTDAQVAGHDWVGEELEQVWQSRQAARHSA